MELISRQEARAKGLKYYFTGKPCRKAHITKRLVSSASCYQCSLEHKANWALENKEKVSEYNKEWRSSNPDYDKEWKVTNGYFERNKERKANYDRQYRERNWEKIARVRKDYYENNRELIAKKAKTNKDARNERNRHRYSTDPVFRGSIACRSALRYALKSIGKKNSGTVYKILGYSPDELKTHLERQFTKSMSWKNHGSKWHIDHITPVSRLIRDGITEPSVVNALTNLRPLEAKANREKSIKVTCLL